MKKQEFLKLLDKYLEGSASEEEEQSLINYYNSFQQSGEWNEAELGSSEEMEWNMWQRLSAGLHRHTARIVPFYRRTWFKIAAAAAIIAAIAGTSWLSLNKEAGQDFVIARQQAAISVINSSKATLVLADGRNIILDEASNGVLSHQGNTIIKKIGDKLVYESPNAPNAAGQSSLMENLVSIPRGRQYQLVLPDGSNVWLNAASSIRFPAAFTHKERNVTLNGEAYFEVAKDAARPFRVYASVSSERAAEGSLIEVLGTHFNVNAYDDESAMKTTLLEGSVKVSAVKGTRPTDDAQVLVPGQQAQVVLHATEKKIKVAQVNVEEVIAWKYNIFNFNAADIKTIMRQISRWYDVDVVYEGNILDRKFTGKMNRNMDLSTILKILEQSNIHFRLVGKKIIVTP